MSEKIDNSADANSKLEETIVPEVEQEQQEQVEETSLTPDDLTDEEFAKSFDTNQPIQDIKEDIKKDDKEDDKDLSDEDVQDKQDWGILQESFRAAGSDVIVKTPQEALEMMQKGIQFNKNQELIKPHLKTAKLLEREKVTPEELLTAIEVARGNKEAIAKVIKDKKIELYDIDETIEDENFEYKPSIEPVTDNDLLFDEITQKYSTDPLFDETVEILSKYDEPSRNKILSNPNYLEQIYLHKKDGFYEKIAGEVSRREIVSGSNGEPFLDRYEKVGTEMLNAGLLVENVETKPKPETKAPSPNLSPSRKKPTKTTKVINPDNLSDEEFAEFFDKYYK